MADITVYEKNTCSTCRSLFTLLTERGLRAAATDAAGNRSAVKRVKFKIVRL